MLGMAARRVIKSEPRRKQAPAHESVVAVATNGNGSAAVSSAAKNGASPRYEQIQQRAYELFLSRGQTHGSDLDDWFRAEHELTHDTIAVH
jgi:Protein of unknown function (DUF2934)